MRGRKPNPTWRRTLDGHPGKRPRNRREPDLPATAAVLDDVPTELHASPVATTEWRRLAPMLRLRKQITDADRSALVALCLEWARYLDATAKVAAEGMVVHSPNGYPMQNPYLSIATKALSACRSLWPELGLTPSSRSRVRMEGEEPDTFSEFDVPLPSPGTSH